MNTKNLIRILTTATLAIILHGCASPATNTASMWTHPDGRASAQIERDLAECRLAGHQRGGFQGGNAAWYLATRNGSVSDDVVRDCMIAKGYKLVGK